MNLNRFSNSITSFGIERRFFSSSTNISISAKISEIFGNCFSINSRTKCFVITDEEAFGVSETTLITYVSSLHEKDGAISQKPAASISYNTFSLYPFSGLLTVNKIAAGISLESLNPGKKAAPLSFETTLLA